MSSPPDTGADRGVRPARAGDAAALARVQAAAWRGSYASVLPGEVLATLTPDALAASWERAVADPPTSRHRVLVAVEGADVVGFAALAPAADADLDPAIDADLPAFVLDPGALGQGHGSRLLQAVVDLLRGQGYGRAHAWLGAAELDLARFLEVAGWARDGARRTLDLHGDGSVTVPQERMHTDLTPADAAPPAS